MLPKFTNVTASYDTRSINSRILYNDRIFKDQFQSARANLGNKEISCYIAIYALHIPKVS